jgi:hypothetical protein
LKNSHDILSNLIDQPISTVAYPFGIQNKTIQRLAKDAGYEFGCINLWGQYQPENSFCLKRIPVYRTDSINSLKRKFYFHKLHRTEILKSKILSFPALLTPIYQKFVKNLYS